jgi:hypothetical protein
MRVIEMKDNSQTDPEYRNEEQSYANKDDMCNLRKKQAEILLQTWKVVQDIRELLDVDIGADRFKYLLC